MNTALCSTPSIAKQEQMNLLFSIWVILRTSYTTVRPLKSHFIALSLFLSLFPLLSFSLKRKSHLISPFPSILSTTLKSRLKEVYPRNREPALRGGACLQSQYSGGRARNCPFKASEGSLYRNYCKFLSFLFKCVWVFCQHVWTPCVYSACRGQKRALHHRRL